MEACGHVDNCLRLRCENIIFTIQYLALRPPRWCILGIINAYISIWTCAGMSFIQILDSKVHAFLWYAYWHGITTASNSRCCWPNKNFSDTFHEIERTHRYPTVYDSRAMRVSIWRCHDQQAFPLVSIRFVPLYSNRYVFERVLWFSGSPYAVMV